MDGSQTTPLLNGPDDQCPMERTSNTRPTGGWRSAIFIIGVEVAERFAYYGIAGNLIMYLTNVLDESTVSAARNVSVWSGVSTMLPLLGGFIADSYLGRYLTILFASFIYLLGLSLLTLSTTTVIPAQYQELLFFVSLYMVSVGEGGHKPCLQAFGADQFDEESMEERKSKNSFFNWWFFGVCGGAAAGVLIVTYVQDDIGWAVGFSLPAFAMAFALIIFLSGSKSYIERARSSQSPLTQVARVLVAAVHKCHLPWRNNSQHEGRFFSVDLEVTLSSSSLAGTDQFKFLDKAAMVDELDEASKYQNRWRLCTVAEVREVKQVMSIVPIWFSCLIYAMLLTQPSTFFTKQCSTMDRKIGSFEVAPASVSFLIGFTSVTLVPIYDRIFVPIARRFSGIPSGITMLQRIGIGMALAVTSMAVAALVETRRLKIAREYGSVGIPNATVPMSFLWLLPQYIIFGISDLFAVVGLQEFFYDQMPDAMRSIGAAVYLSIFGMGNFLNSILISLVEGIRPEWITNDLNKSHLDYYYWLLTVLSTLSLVMFMRVAKQFLYKQTYCDIP